MNARKGTRHAGSGVGGVGRKEVRGVSKSQPTFGMGSGAVGRRMTVTDDRELVAKALKPTGLKRMAAEDARAARSHAKSTRFYDRTEAGQKVSKPKRRSLAAWDEAEINSFGKRVRNKDAESDRQRRLGMAQAGLTGGAGYAGFKTGQEVRDVTQAVRRQKGAVPASGAAARFYGGTALSREGKTIKPGFAVSRRGGKLGAATVLLTAGAGATNRYARGERNRRWE